MKKEIWIGITGLGVGLLVGATLENKLFSTRKQDEKIIKNLKEDNEELTEINEALKEKIASLEKANEDLKNNNKKKKFQNRK